MIQEQIRVHVRSDCDLGMACDSTHNTGVCLCYH